MTENKYHWYDGWFYDTLIAPNQDKLFNQVKEQIEPDSRIIDVGCGTGRLEFVLADKCKSVIGIDLSEKNIKRANMTLLKHPVNNISFHFRSLSDLINEGVEHFDVAVLTYVIHEVDEKERITLLKQTATVAGKIIIGDYLVPGPKGFGGFLSEVIEFIAGAEHYRNFKSYMNNGGIHYLADKAGLKVVYEISNHPLSNHIVVLGK
jgi:SAM-dependent methyltransferase